MPRTNWATASDSEAPETTASKMWLMPRTPQVMEKPVVGAGMAA